MNQFNILDKKKHFKWLEKCLVCWEACEQCITESISTGKYLSTCNICRDCAEMCSMCIKFEAQWSDFFENLCRVCADICNACASECGKFSNASVTFKTCADACTECAELSLEIAEKNKGVVNKN